MGPIETIREAVRGKGRLMSQSELSAASGVPESTISTIVSGQVRNPGITTVHRLLDAIETARIRTRPAVVDRARGERVVGQ